MNTEPQIKEQYTITGSIQLKKTIGKTEANPDKTVDGSIVLSFWDNGALSLAVEFKPVQIETR